MSWLVWNLTFTFEIWIFHCVKGLFSLFQVHSLLFHFLVKVQVEKIKNPEEHIGPVLERAKPEYIQKTYRIPTWNSPEDFLEKLAFRTGKLLKVCMFVFGCPQNACRYLCTKHEYPFPNNWLHMALGLKGDLGFGGSKTFFLSEAWAYTLSCSSEAVCTSWHHE